MNTENDDLELETTPEEEVVETQTTEELPAWEFPAFTPPPVADPDPEPGVFDTLKQEATNSSLQAIGGLLQNQATLRNTLTAQGATPDTIALAEATLLSMPPNVMIQPGAAQVAVNLAIGSQITSGKSWKQAPVSTPPPANGVGRENPQTVTQEFSQEFESAKKAFGDLGLTDEQIMEMLR